MSPNSRDRNQRQQHYVSRPAANDLETARQANLWPLPLRISAGGRLRKGVGNYERDLKKLEHKQHSDLLENLFWYQEFAFGSSHPFRFSESDTFGTALFRLRQTLKRSHRSSSSFLQLCIINTSPASETIASWPARLIAFVRSRLNELLVFPRWVIGIELEQAWGELCECACKSIERTEKLLKVEQLSHPEFRRQFLSHSSSRCRCRDFRIAEISHFSTASFSGSQLSDREGQKRLGNSGLRSYPEFRVEMPSKGRERTSSSAKLQLTQCQRIFDRKTASFSFTWQRTAPRYNGGIDNFLWERHSLPPTCDYAEIFFQDDRASPAPRRVLITCSTTSKAQEISSIMDDLKYILKTRKADDPNMWPFMLLLQANPHSDGYSVLPIFIVLQEIIVDTATFLQQAWDEIIKLSFSGRNHASVSKVQYLCHLDDCRESALMGVIHAYSIAKDLTSIVKHRKPDQTPATIEEEFLKEKQGDMEFLIEQLEEDLKDRIRLESIQMKEHRMLVQCRQISILTYLAFIFLPLVFVTGMLSMNISNPTSVSHNPNHSNSDPAPQTTPLFKRQEPVMTTTPSLASALGPVASSVLVLAQNMNNMTTVLSSNPQAYIWPFHLFLALIITFCIMSATLPLIGPSLLRVLLRPYRRGTSS
ncbi:hypothetical protein LSUB1_G002428 [Lachnellula subtilissima]|uniref:Uncharacterized protein n=1 Tax=Lachnellula subtilissima TaxID=602034 RepID=A0A8H8UC50_9HELO|nr:hypothetical protein LSUB1_G002428 [Lachnellula subtilissima]